MDNNGIMIQMGEDGVFGLYEEPFITIEIKTEEDFNKINKALELGHELLQIRKAGRLSQRLVQIKGEVEFAYECNLSDRTLSPQEKAEMTKELNKSLGVIDLLKELVSPEEK